VRTECGARAGATDADDSSECAQVSGSASGTSDASTGDRLDLFRTASAAVEFVFGHDDPFWMWRVFKQVDDAAISIGDRDTTIG
jgi:hypothetical protein